MSASDSGQSFPGPGADEPVGYKRSPTTREQRESTSDLVASLRQHIGLLRRIREPGSDAILAALEQTLGEIEEEVRSLDVDELTRSREARERR